MRVPEAVDKDVTALRVERWVRCARERVAGEPERRSPRDEDVLADLGGLDAA